MVTLSCLIKETILITLDSYYGNLGFFQLRGGTLERMELSSCRSAISPLGSLNSSNRCHTAPATPTIGALLIPWFGGPLYNNKNNNKETTKIVLVII